MNDFYCPYCEHGMNKEDTKIHEDDVIGKWDIECSDCKKTFGLTAEPDILYSTEELEQSHEH